MKIKNLLFITALMLFLGVSNAQTTNWQLAAIGMDGTNGYHGVNVYYTTTSGKSGDVLLLKLVNTNAYEVKAQWINALVTNADKELYGNSKLVSYKIAANSEVKGDVKDKASVLCIKLSDYGIKASDLKIFAGSSFDVIKQ